MFREVDRILRGKATQLSSLRDGTIRIDLGGVCIMLCVLGAIYGIGMSVFALVNRDQPEVRQVVSTVIKVPALFYLTLLVTFPSLYVFNALVGSRLSAASVLRLIIASLAVSLAVLAAFAPIVAFFSFTTQSYSFMILLNVVIFSIAGILGLAFLLQTLHRLTQVQGEPASTDEEHDGDTDESALERLDDQPLGSHVKIVFRVWILVFGLVGAQMAWVMRPFIGEPTGDFAWFRARESNFFEAVWTHLVNLF